jgi:spore maturation protein SpmB
MVLDPKTGEKIRPYVNHHPTPSCVRMRLSQPALPAAATNFYYIDVYYGAIGMGFGVKRHAVADKLEKGLAPLLGALLVHLEEQSP